MKLVQVSRLVRFVIILNNVGEVPDCDKVRLVKVLKCLRLVQAFE